MSTSDYILYGYDRYQKRQEEKAWYDDDYACSDTPEELLNEPDYAQELLDLAEIAKDLHLGKLTINRILECPATKEGVIRAENIKKSAYDRKCDRQLARKTA